MRSIIAVVVQLPRLVAQLAILVTEFVYILAADEPLTMLLLVHFQLHIFTITCSGYNAKQSSYGVLPVQSPFENMNTTLATKSIIDERSPNQSSAKLVPVILGHSFILEND